MTHIKRTNEINEGLYSQENQDRFLENIISNNDIRVFVKSANGNTNYNEGDGDDFEIFTNHCKDMKETCNGTITVSTMADYEYNVYVEDEEGKMYASINFMLVYFNPETENSLNTYFN